MAAQSKKKRRILITSALPYVNNVPHLGNIIGCVLSADVFARFCRSRGYKTLYICGTDEHGTTTETKAIEECLTPKEICDKYYAIHKDIYEWFGCSFDAFGRTSKPIHHRITKAIFKDLQKNGFVLKKTVEQSFCEKCKRFLADRFIEGTCPHCKFEDARGDQCDSCGKLLTPTELKKPRCKLCGSTPKRKKSTHLFINLEKLQPELQAWVKAQAVKGFWSENAKTIAQGWFKEGLKPRAITRDLSWGVSVPVKGFEKKVFYVWFDAPIGYISITADKFKDWEKWWKNKDVELFQFMGKDNIAFHTIFFPGMLIGTKDTWTMLHHIASTEFLNYESGKFSKSRNIGVFGSDAMETGIPSDVWRYYLLINRPERTDTTFTWDDFGEKLNNELVANLGNFVNRLVSFLNRFTESRIPEANISKAEEGFWKEIVKREESITGLLEQVRLKDALKEIMALSKQGNIYFQKSEPWKLIKKDKAKADAALFILANIVKDLAILVEPFLPETSKNMFLQLNLKGRTWDDLGKLSLDFGHEISKAKPLFSVIESDTLAELKARFSGEFVEETKESQFEKLMLVTARVKEVQDHPDADKLYILTITLGKEKRQLVAGLKGYYTKEELVKKNIIIVANLKPAKLRGVYSQGMLLAAEEDGIVEILSPDCKPGIRVGLEGVVPDTVPGELEFQEFMKIPLAAVKGVAQLGDKPLTIGSKLITLEKVNNGKIH